MSVHRLCRGMRLSDTIFLTLTICLLQVYIGMRCLYEVHHSIL